MDFATHASPYVAKGDLNSLKPLTADNSFRFSLRHRCADSKSGWNYGLTEGERTTRGNHLSHTETVFTPLTVQTYLAERRVPSFVASTPEACAKVVARLYYAAKVGNMPSYKTGGKIQFLKSAIDDHFGLNEEST